MEEVSKEMGELYYLPAKSIIQSSLAHGFSRGIVTTDNYLLGFFLISPNVHYPCIDEFLPQHRYGFYVAGVYLNKSYRSLGLGFQLGNHCLNYLSKGDSNMIWTTVSPVNHQSNQLFKKLGFHHIATTYVYENKIYRTIIYKNFGHNQVLYSQLN